MIRPEQETGAYRIATYRQWCELVANYPHDYRIDYHVEKGKWCDAGLFKLVEGEWYLVQALPRWMFIAEDFVA
jgi:hypothetical protein